MSKHTQEQLVIVLQDIRIVTTINAVI